MDFFIGWEPPSECLDWFERGASRGWKAGRLDPTVTPLYFNEKFGRKRFNRHSEGKVRRISIYWDSSLRSEWRKWSGVCISNYSKRILHSAERKVTKCHVSWEEADWTKWRNAEVARSKTNDNFAKAKCSVSAKCEAIIQDNVTFVTHWNLYHPIRLRHLPHPGRRVIGRVHPGRKTSAILIFTPKSVKRQFWEFWGLNE